MNSSSTIANGTAALQPAIGQASPATPWLPTPPGDTSWLDAATPAGAPGHAAGIDLMRIFDGALPLQSWINDGVGWVVAHCRPFFQAVRTPIDAALTGANDVLQALPSLAVIAIIGLLAWQFTSCALAIGTVLALLVLAMLGVWPEAMVTLSLVLTSLAFCLAIGLPLGIYLPAATARKTSCARCSTPCRRRPRSSIWCRSSCYLVSAMRRA